jgi:predicted DNA-binding protein
MERMKIMLNLKIPAEMKEALKGLADEQLLTVSDVVRQAIVAHLEKHGIDWREGSKK